MSYQQRLKAVVFLCLCQHILLSLFHLSYLGLHAWLWFLLAFPYLLMVGFVFVYLQDIGVVLWLGAILYTPKVPYQIKSVEVSLIQASGPHLTPAVFVS